MPPRVLISSAGRPVRVGSIVRVVSLPPRSSYVALPMKSRRVFRLIIGHPFRVYALTVPPGLPELRVSRVVDPVLGGIGHSVWLEPECVA